MKSLLISKLFKLKSTQNLDVENSVLYTNLLFFLPKIFLIVTKFLQKTSLGFFFTKTHVHAKICRYTYTHRYN